jgi:hypothetical protein
LVDQNGNTCYNVVMTFKVYWTEAGGAIGGEAFHDIGVALNRCQELRNSGRRFVTMASELDDMVGEFGVTEAGPDYDWKKRRV